jgi:hypothetical protein
MAKNTKKMPATLQLPRQPGDLVVLRTNVREEARTRGFASPALAGFAFIWPIMDRL